MWASTGSSTGRPISSYLSLADNEKIIDGFRFDSEGEIFIYTKSGYGFIALEKNLETNKKTGKKVMNVKGEDIVIGVSKVVKDSDSVAIICDSDGKNKMLAFDINELPKLDKGICVPMTRALLRSQVLRQDPEAVDVTVATANNI